jgi:hypothetical protein
LEDINTAIANGEIDIDTVRAYLSNLGYNLVTTTDKDGKTIIDTRAS